MEMRGSARTSRDIDAAAGESGFSRAGRIGRNHGEFTGSDPILAGRIGAWDGIER
jgi:hypothetical protein